MHIIAAKAVAFKEAMEPGFVDYQRRVIDNARTLADELQARGIRVLSGGTDNHLLVADLRPLDLTGRAIEVALDKAGISVSRSTVPFDPKPPRVTSGVRIGSPAVTTRGFGRGEMQRVGAFIAEVIHNHEDEALLARVREQVKDLCSSFPVPGIDPARLAVPSPA